MIKPDVSSLYTGCIARSLSGHDAGRYYVVLGGADKTGWVYVSDGKHHMVSEPKLKNAKHLFIGCCDSELLFRIKEGGCTDSKLRERLNLCRVGCNPLAAGENAESSIKIEFPMKG